MVDPKRLAQKALEFIDLEDIEQRILARAFLSELKPASFENVMLDDADKLLIKSLAENILLNKSFDRYVHPHTIIVDSWIEAIDTVRANKIKEKEGTLYDGRTEYD